MKVDVRFTAPVSTYHQVRRFASPSRARRFMRRHPDCRFHGVHHATRGYTISVPFPPARVFQWCGELAYRVHNVVGGTMCCTLKAPCGALGHLTVAQRIEEFISGRWQLVEDEVILSQ